MQVGGSGSTMSQINVTPLVDVVLVLLIIFMVITPVVQMGYLVRVPPPAPANLPPSAVQDQIIIRLISDTQVAINKEEMPIAQFPARIRLLIRFTRRPLRGHDSVPRHGEECRREEHRHHRRRSDVFTDGFGDRSVVITQCTSRKRRPLAAVFCFARLQTEVRTS